MGGCDDQRFWEQGQGWHRFSAEVGWASWSRIGREARQVPKLHFEVYVDDQLVAHSGLMTLTDAPRLLVAEALGGAKQIRLITRYHNDGLGLEAQDQGGEIRVEGVWGAPAFHR